MVQVLKGRFLLKAVKKRFWNNCDKAIKQRAFVTQTCKLLVN